MTSLSSSARETACRVAAGAVAKKILKHFNVSLAAYVKQIGSIEADIQFSDIQILKEAIYKDTFFCPDRKASSNIELLLKKTIE